MVQHLKMKFRRCHFGWSSWRPKQKINVLDTDTMTERRMPRVCSGSLAARHVLAIMVMLGFALNGMVHHSASVAIFAHHDPRLSEDVAAYVANNSYIKQYCQARKDQNNYNVTDYVMDVVNGSLYNASETNDTAMDYEYDVPEVKVEPKVPVTEEELVNAALREAYLWGCLITPLPGSRLAAQVGAKRIFGLATLASALSSILVPAAWNTPAHVIIRVFQGMFMGLTWPAVHMLAASWLPTFERSRFVSFYTAWFVGCALSVVVGGPLVRAAGTDSLFYLLSVLAVAWFVVWSRLVYDSPARHPRISTVERRHIESCTRSSVRREKVPPLPLKSFLTSLPVWACAVAIFGSQWGQWTLHLAATKYLRLVYGFAITDDSILCALPYIGHFLSAITFGHVVDHVRAKGIVSTTTSRKLLVYISHFFPAAILFIVGYSGCDPAAPAALFTAAVGLSSATAAGAYASALEIAPNFAGWVFGLSHTLGAAGNLLANLVITEGLHGGLPGSWRLVFGVAASVLAVSAVVFMALGSGTVQPWNLPGQLTPAEGGDPAEDPEEQNSVEGEEEIVVDIPTPSTVDAEDADNIVKDEDETSMIPHAIKV